MNWFNQYLLFMISASLEHFFVRRHSDWMLVDNFILHSYYRGCIALHRQKTKNLLNTKNDSLHLEMIICICLFCLYFSFGINTFLHWSSSNFSPSAHCHWLTKIIIDLIHLLSFLLSTYFPRDSMRPFEHSILIWPKLPHISVVTPVPIWKRNEFLH